MSDGIKTQISGYIQMVQCGAKPIAFMDLQTRYIDQAREMTDKRKLHMYVC